MNKEKKEHNNSHHILPHILTEKHIKKQHVEPGKIKELLHQGKTDRIRRILSQLDVSTIASLINQLSDRYKIKLYLLLPTNVSSDVLLEVSSHSRRVILKGLKDKYIVSMIQSADSDDSADILGEVPKSKVRRIIQRLSRKKKEAVAPLIEYEEDTAGGLMQTELVSVRKGMTVKEALDYVKKKLREVEGVNYVYVVDSRNRILGVVSVQRLISEHPNKKIERVMKRDVVTVDPHMDKEQVARIFQEHDLIALPVVDKKGVLLGRVTADDVMDVITEEATEDMYRIAGLHPEEDVFDPLFSSVKRRLPWLIINLGTAILAAITVSLFTDTLQKVVILAAFMPIVAGMGGNAGTQTLTIVVRSIALNEIRHKDSYRKVLVKEGLTGLINGMATGIIMAVIAALWTKNPAMGVVILLAMMTNMLVAGLVGAAIPIILKKAGVDPAVASSIFVTTFTDVVGFFSFLGIATLLMNFLI
ncbi:magnesium transporter [Candidatus Woesearchaeota archaeon]|nr:MAG: magnesium transporter [Candidatus Woesearchaeota archaeon]